MNIYDEVGVASYINANEWFTSMGGSMLPAPVIEAMNEASQRAVRLIPFQIAVDAAVAKLTNNEAACVTSSATSRIVLTVAAFLSELDPEKCARLPDTSGMRRDVIIQACDRFGEDPVIRIPGARIVEIGDADGTSEAQFRDALTPLTAAVITSPPRVGMLPLDVIVKHTRPRYVGVIVDLAWSLPPEEHLWKFTRDGGADVALVSGGKGLRGPQGTGVILGRREVVDFCRRMVPPDTGPGRPMKVGKEAMATSRKQIIERLFDQEPRILVREAGESIRVNAGTLAEGQEKLVASRVRQALLDSGR